MITEEERIEYAPTEEFVSLKFRVKLREELPDYVRYITEFALDKNPERTRNELEICRFKLKQGAHLRTEYKDFYDIQTEFDTVNLADSTWAGIGGNTLSKEVTDYFAKEVLKCRAADGQDLQFAYLLLHGREAVNFQILRDYICRKTGEEVGYFDSREAFGKLEEILNQIRRGTSGCRAGRSDMDSRMIIFD